MDLHIGSTYNFSLHATFAGWVNHTQATIKAQVDLDVASSIYNVVAEHELNKHKLPDNLKELDIYSERFYVISSTRAEGKIVVPASYIADESIVKVDIIKRNLEFTLDNADEYARLVRLLTDNLFSFQQLS